MRMHIELADELVRRIDESVGPRGRSAYVREAIERALSADERSASLLSVAGALQDTEHEWDDDTAGWVRAQRGTDNRRAG